MIAVCLRAVVVCLERYFEGKDSIQFFECLWCRQKNKIIHKDTVMYTIKVDLDSMNIVFEVLFHKPCDYKTLGNIIVKRILETYYKKSKKDEVLVTYPFNMHAYAHTDRYNHVWVQSVN